MDTRPVDRGSTARSDEQQANVAPPRPDLSELETDVLFKRVQQAGDARARDELMDRFMPLARKLASRYMNPYEPYEDLVQVACIGLLGAIARFDPRRGVAFTSFAIPTILGELKRYFRSTGWSAHVPRRAQELALQVDKAARQISSRTGRVPGVDELASYLELSTEDVLAGLDAGLAHYSISLDAPSTSPGADGEPEPLVSSIGSDDNGYRFTETTISLAAALKNLPRLEREALSLRLIGDFKQTEIADRLGCSQMQVSRLLRRAAAHIHELTEA